MYSIAHNSIASKVLDGKMLLHQSQVSEAEEKMQWLKMQVTILNNRNKPSLKLSENQLYMSKAQKASQKFSE